MSCATFTTLKHLAVFFFHILIKNIKGSLAKSRNKRRFYHAHKSAAYSVRFTLICMSQTASFRNVLPFETGAWLEEMNLIIGKNSACEQDWAI